MKRPTYQPEFTPVPKKFMEGKSFKLDGYLQYEAFFHLFIKNKVNFNKRDMNGILYLFYTPNRESNLHTCLIPTTKEK
jgi:hypothetical protein